MFSIVGSCLSRDVVSFIAPGTANQYLARSSIASVVSPPSDWATGLKLVYGPSLIPWHRLTLEADIHKAPWLRRFGLIDNDFVLIDLIEERMSLLECEPGRYLTYNELLKRTNIDELRGDRAVISLFSDAGLTIWRNALPAFASLLARHLDARRVIIHRAFYAGDDPANVWLRAMYAALAATLPGASIVEADASNLRANPMHKWGAAPFHLVDDYYRDVAAQVVKIAGGALLPRATLTVAVATLAADRI